MNSRAKRRLTSLVVLFLLFIGNQASSQEWAPIGATWYYSTWVSIEWIGTDYTKTVSEKDTLVDGKMCRKLVVYSSQDEYLTHHLTYSQNDSVFFWQDSRFYLLFDFSAEKGDTVSLDFKSSTWKGEDIVDTIITVEGVVTKTDSLMESNLPPLKEIYVDVTNEPDSAHLSEYHWPSQLMYIQQLGNIYSQGSILNYLDFGSSIPSSAPYRCYEDNMRYYMLPNWRSVGISCDHSIVGVEEVYRSDKVQISPNPTSGMFTITLPKNAAPIERVEVFDVQGKLISTMKLNNSSASYSMESQPEGVYLIRLKSKDGEVLQTSRLVKT